MRRNADALAKTATALGLEDALDGTQALQIVAAQLRLSGWVVNTAMETGGDVERITLSASRTLVQFMAAATPPEGAE